MGKYSETLDKIIRNAQLLLEKYLALKEKKEKLETENQELKDRLTAMEAEKAQLEEKLQLARIAHSMEGEKTDENRQELKRKINEYIKEIDKCIALLNE